MEIFIVWTVLPSHHQYDRDVRGVFLSLTGAQEEARIIVAENPHVEWRKCGELEWLGDPDLHSVTIERSEARP